MATSSITFKRLAAFAPAPLAAALQAEKKATFTAADVQALAARFQDTQDFESSTYLREVLANLQVDSAAPAPADPITREAQLAAELAEKIAKAAKPIAGATGMPANHAVLYAEAGFSVEQSERGWKAGLPGGQALMFVKLGLSVDDAISLGAAKVDARKAYDLIAAGVPADVIPKAIAAGLEPYDLKSYTDAGFSFAQGVELKGLGVSPSHAPRFLTLDQVKVALTKGVDLSDLRPLIQGGFSFDQSLELLALTSSFELYPAVDVQKQGKLSFKEIVELVTSGAMKANRGCLTELVGAGFTVEQLKLTGKVNLNSNTIKGVLAAGYSPSELLTLWQANVGLSTHPSGQHLSEYHAAGFSVAQLLEAKDSGLDDYSVERFQQMGFSPDEMLTLARAGYGSTSKLQFDYLSLGLTPREALDLILSGD
jgi:hypothetical protein